MAGIEDEPISALNITREQAKKAPIAGWIYRLEYMSFVLAVGRDLCEPGWQALSRHSFICRSGLCQRRIKVSKASAYPKATTKNLRMINSRSKAAANRPLGGGRNAASPPTPQTHDEGEGS